MIFIQYNCCILLTQLSLYSLYYRHIDESQEKYIKRLADTVAIKSVSAWPESRTDILTMQEWVKTVSS